MPHRKRKVRKLRGSRHHGWGQVGQHRGHGGKGGRGKAGGHKHKWSFTLKYQPDRYGKHGFKRPNIVEENTINVGSLDELAKRLVERNQALEEEGKISIDLNKLGYDKILGWGQVTNPLIVRVNSFSKKAAKKIEEAGGQILKPD